MQVAWVVAVWAVAIVAFVLVFHQPGGVGRMVPRQYEPPIADAAEWDADPSVRLGAGGALPQPGSSTAPETLPNRR
jgi:hypothetical protein